MSSVCVPIDPVDPSRLILRCGMHMRTGLGTAGRVLTQTAEGLGAVVLGARRRQLPPAPERTTAHGGHAATHTCC